MSASCRFCSQPAVAVYWFSDGCVCFPDDREQALCAQHENRATPLGTMELVREIAGTTPRDGAMKGSAETMDRIYEWTNQTLREANAELMIARSLVLYLEQVVSGLQGFLGTFPETPPSDLHAADEVPDA